MKRVIFAGTPHFGLPCLEALHQSSHDIIAVYTQPDRPAGRGRMLQASPIKQWALEHQIPVHQPIHFKSAADIETLAALKPDVMIVIAYGLLLPQVVLDIPRFGCINVHASMLPRWRGASPIQQVILHGDEMSGVTIMQMEAGLDTGPMLLQRTCHITPETSAGMLHDTLASIAVDPLLSVVSHLEESILHAVIQDDSKATYAKKIQKQDACIQWHQPALTIHRQIRAFNPWPVAWTHVKGQFLKIYTATVSETDQQDMPGKILDITKQGMLIATGNDALRIETMQFDGKKVLPVRDWLNSVKPSEWVGQVLR